MKRAKATGKKHLILIHGRATKPSEREKRRLVKKTLLHGLDRVAPEAAKAIRTRDVRFSLAYYGDICNGIMLASDKTTRANLSERDPAHDYGPCEAKGSYNKHLKLLLDRDSFTKSDYKRLLADHDDYRHHDDIASALSGLLNAMGWSEKVIREATPDMSAYLTQYHVGSAIRQRLQELLAPALKRGDDVCLVSHSMGCIVSYDVLWKFSRMSEYEKIRERKVNHWITLGSPLGEPGVQDNLYDAKVDNSGRYPTNIEHWTNIAAFDDFVAHDEDAADDFAAMTEPRGDAPALVKSIRDSRMYNFWTGSKGANPHKLYGYLDHPHVATEIAKWIAEEPAKTFQPSPA